MGFVSVSMGFHFGFLCISLWVSTIGFTWGFTGFPLGFLLVSLGFLDGCLLVFGWVSLGFDGFPLGSLCGSPWVSMRFPWISMNLYVFHWVSVGFPVFFDCFPSVSMGFPGFR